MKTMDHVFAILFFSLAFTAPLNCTQSDADDSRDEWTAIALFALNPPLEFAACAAEYPRTNPLYFQVGAGWAQDVTPARLVVLGDSTMDISTRYPGWLSAGSRTRAVSGNTLCDMVQQLPAVQLQGLSEIFISTADGNGVLQGLPADVSIRAGRELIDRLRFRWPAARITIAGIHPTLIASANANKGIVNAGIRAHLHAAGNSCYLDPLPVFGVAEGAPASADQMIDTIHYNEAMSWAIKQAALIQCGVQI